MEFESPKYLYLLIIIPLLIAVYIYGCYTRKRNIKRYGDPELVKLLIPSHSTLRSRIVFWISLLAAVMIILALARPRYGKGKTTIITKGVEMMVALDISNSMLADDVSPNRLEKAKRVIKRLASELKGNKVGLVIFAGDAYVQLPITDDFISIEMFIDNISTDLIEIQGTNIAAAIDVASRSFTQNDKIGKAIVLITDGENHEPGAEEAAKRAADDGRRIFVLGIGTPSGGKIPLGGGKYLYDREGNAVKTKLNESMAERIAIVGNGNYQRVDDENAKNAQKFLSDQLAKMNQEETKTHVYSGYEELFIYPAMLAFILLLLDILILAFIDLKKHND